MIADFDLDPYERCGPLTRGLPFGRVGAVLNRTVTPFRKAPTSAHDALDASGAMHVFFDADGGCNGVEFFAGRGLSVTCAGIGLMVADAASLIDALVRLGQHWDVDTYGVRAPMLGIATFSPDFDWDRGARGIDALYVSLDPDFVP